MNGMLINNHSTMALKKLSPQIASLCRFARREELSIDLFASADNELAVDFISGDAGADAE